MKDENKNPSEESRNKSIEIAKEKLTELDIDQLEKLAGGAIDLEGPTAPTGCTCVQHSCTEPV